MSVEVINANIPVMPKVTIKDMEVGILYKLPDPYSYNTLYIKTLGGHVLWFEPREDGRGLNLKYNPGEGLGVKFVRALEGTQVIIKN
jgi:hypothetical protein